MDFPVAPAIREALQAVVDGDEFGYPDWGGVEVLSPAGHQFAQRMSERYGWEPELDRVHDLTNIIQGVRAVIFHLSQPGDGVVLHMPARLNDFDGDVRVTVRASTSGASEANGTCRAGA